MTPSIWTFSRWVRQWRSTALSLLIAFAPLAVTAQGAGLSELDRVERALAIIQAFSEKFCSEVPTSGSRGQVELSLSAKAELTGTLRRLAEIGVASDNRYQTEHYRGLLQRDLATALRDRATCKERVWSDLRDRLLPQARSRTEPAPQRRNPPRPAESVPSTAPAGSVSAAQPVTMNCVQDSREAIEKQIQERISMHECQRAMARPPAPPTVYTFLHSESLPREECRSLYIEALEREFPGRRTENYPSGLFLGVDQYGIHIACRIDFIVLSVAGPDYDIAVRHANRLYERVASRGACPAQCPASEDPYLRRQ